MAETDKVQILPPFGACAIRVAVPQGLTPLAIDDRPFGAPYFHKLRAMTKPKCQVAVHASGFGILSSFVIGNSSFSRVVPRKMLGFRGRFATDGGIGGAGSRRCGFFFLRPGGAVPGGKVQADVGKPMDSITTTWKTVPKRYKRARTEGLTFGPN